MEVLDLQGPDQSKQAISPNPVSGLWDASDTGYRAGLSKTT